LTNFGAKSAKLAYSSFSSWLWYSEAVLLEYRNVDGRVIVLSHWPHAAEQVPQHVAAHVPSVKALLTAAMIRLHSVKKIW